MSMNVSGRNKAEVNQTQFQSKSSFIRTGSNALNSLGRSVIQLGRSMNQALERLSTGVQNATRSLLHRETGRPSQTTKDLSQHSISREKNHAGLSESENTYIQEKFHSSEGSFATMSSGKGKDPSSSEYFQASNTSAKANTSYHAPLSGMQLAAQLLYDNRENLQMKAVDYSTGRFNSIKLSKLMEEEVKPAQLSAILNDKNARAILFQDDKFRSAALAYASRPEHPLPEVINSHLQYVVNNIASKKDKFVKLSEVSARNLGTTPSRYIALLVLNSLGTENRNLSEILNNSEARATLEESGLLAIICKASAESLLSSQEKILKEATDNNGDVDWEKFGKLMEDTVKPIPLSEILKDDEASHILLDNSEMRLAISHYANIHDLPDVKYDVLRYLTYDIVENVEKYLTEAVQRGAMENETDVGFTLIMLLRRSFSDHGRNFDEVFDTGLSPLFNEDPRLEVMSKMYQSMREPPVENLSEEAAPNDKGVEAYNKGIKDAEEGSEIMKLINGELKQFLVGAPGEDASLPPSSELKREIRQLMIKVHPDKVGNEANRAQFDALNGLKEMLDNNVFEQYKAAFKEYGGEWPKNE